MSDENVEYIEKLNLKLKSATKLSIIKESELLKLRNNERSLKEELSNTTNEVKLLMLQLEDTKKQITQIKGQISITDICIKSEETKIEMYMKTFNNYKNGYEEKFQKEQAIVELRNKKQQEKDAEEEEQMRQKEKQIMEKNEKISKEAENVEKECEAIETECIVLKKRNNAIMRKLRRMLLDTENSRREMLQRNTGTKSLENSYDIKKNL